MRGQWRIGIMQFITKRKLKTLGIQIFEQTQLHVEHSI